jgi:hypothetical protein
VNSVGLFLEPLPNLALDPYGFAQLGHLAEEQEDLEAAEKRYQEVLLRIF